MTDGQLIPEVGRQFLLTELKTGLTFAKLALSAPDYDRARIERDTRNARKAYDSFLRFRGRVDLTDAENTQLQTVADQLKQALRSLGEKIG